MSTAISLVESASPPAPEPNKVPAEKSKAKTKPDPKKANKSAKRIRYAMVALGNIAQVAILPGFLNAKENSELTVFVSDDPKKLKKLSKLYQVKNCYSYEEYEDCLHSGEIDAVYITLPNTMHHEFGMRAAAAGIHVLCEKPLASTERECAELIRACEAEDVKLMTAYRLHFEQANLEAVELVNSGKLGEPRFFSSTFSMQVKPGIRTQARMGGGTLYDIGIYCINAARYLFKSDPEQAFAFSTKGSDERFREVDEMTAATLRFPKKRFASFTCSFGAADTAAYEVVGTKGSIRVVHSYDLSEPMEMQIKIGDKTITKQYEKRDQFGPEIVYFSDCILKDRQPEPSGLEGLIDVHVIRSLYASAQQGRAVPIRAFPSKQRPTVKQEIRRPARKALKLINTRSPTR